MPITVTHSFGRIPRVGARYIHNSTGREAEVLKVRFGKVTWQFTDNPGPTAECSLGEFCGALTWSESAYIKMGMGK